MRKISCLFCVALFLNIFPLITLASYAGGTGVVGDPYQLSTCEQLQAVNLNLGAYFLVTDDIDCSETVSWNEGLGFLPLGSTTDPFIGNFNGAGHKINDLVINRGASDNIAPFGYVGAGGVIERVGINRGKFTGSGYTAGLVSQNFGTISQSYAVSDVTTLKTLASYSAGLVGLNEGTVTDSYARGSVTGTSNARIAGLIGNHKSAGSLTNSFAASVISGSGDSYMKGLIAYPASSWGTVTNSFWDINVSGQDVSFGGTGTTTDVLKMLANYTSNGWSSDIWAIDVNKNHGYPYLKQNDFGLDPIIEIYNITDLQNIQTNLGGRYIQMAEIDASVTSTWGEGAGFTPLTIFYGSFDGNGYYITNLTINRPTTDYVGVFAQNRGTVSNFKLADSSITGRDYVGALAGYNSGTIYRSKAYRLNDSSNQVNGYSYTAGLVGYNGPVGTISQSYAVSDVTTLKTLASYSAGLVGLNEGTVTDSYARGSVTGTRNARIAGLIGYHKSTGSLTNSFAASVISGSGSSYMKGLISYPASSIGAVSNSFWDINVSGQDASYGGMGTTTSALKIASTFTDVGWNLEDVWHMDGIKNDGYPYFLLDSDDFVVGDPEFTLIINRTGEGSVYVNDSLYSLPLNFSSGTAITLIASSSLGWNFDSWSDGSTSTEKNFELTANETFGVTFVSSESEEEDEDEEGDPITESDSGPQEEITGSHSSSGSSASTRLANFLSLGETQMALDLWLANPNIFSLQDLTLLLAHLTKKDTLLVSTGQIKRNLKLGDISPEVTVLQKFLNKNGFTLISQGPGSPGQETSKFGLLTQKALIKFQEFYADEILKPLGLTRGTGYLGLATRNKIQEIMATGN